NGLEVIHTFTRAQPPGWRGYARRIDTPMLREVMQPLGPAPLTYICGPTLLVEAAANGLAELGVPPAKIRTERFGPTGKCEGAQSMADTADLNRALMLDGNAVAGLLREVFALEMTANPAKCAHCGAVGALGTLLAFTQAPGVVLGCPGCEQVMLRI